MVPRPPTKTLGVFSSKGGTGKTTVALHLAVNASAAGLKVVIADLDPQRSAMAWQTERQDRSIQVILPMPNKLLEWQSLASARGFDLMIIDTPPVIGPHTIEALRASHFALAVTRTNALDIWAMSKVAELFEEAGKPAAFVLNQVPSQRLGQELATTTAAVERLGSYGIKVAPVGLRQRVIYSASTAQGRCAQELDPASVAAREVAMLFDYVWGQMNNPDEH